MRITPKWYLTAAHCVSPLCDKGCEISVDLLQGKLAASAVVHHKSDRSGRRVFVHPDYRADKTDNIRQDLALIRFTPSAQDYYFADFAAADRLDYKTFIARLQKPAYSEQLLQWQALTQGKTPLCTISTLTNRHIRQPLAVPLLQPDGIFFHQSQTDDFYYFADLRMYVGTNFGVKPGMSGSGVVLPGGDVIGVVSASLEGVTELEAYNEQGQVVGRVPYWLDKFYFTPFTGKNVRFIQSVLNSFHDQERADFKRISSDQAALTEQTAAGDPLSSQAFTSL